MSRACGDRVSDSRSAQSDALWDQSNDLPKLRKAFSHRQKERARGLDGIADTSGITSSYATGNVTGTEDADGHTTSFLLDALGNSLIPIITLLADVLRGTAFIDGVKAAA